MKEQASTPGLWDASPRSQAGLEPGPKEQGGGGSHTLLQKERAQSPGRRQCGLTDTEFALCPEGCREH